ncbi:hypothetical protein M419DRAFT_68534 [Trichoderma reesei RUT C-30]|jgi:hypothetical protein|uniref:Uncharacterized protein n=1 Tax=Hypocrea jecorina (strain ATCC 56765 / BCRC 32924 / NRRL 11460 / Rut C-30) TaxID=1344414 RepID=A0A024SK46_HYPJR|nr:hypothetical protein M419DRAFT_68534 [Trichoderma reesei RUT C-30]
MQLSKGEEHAQARRRANSCIGWHCLNSVTHFGIIFSIVVTFLILSVVWMYCMGRARIFRKQTEAQITPDRRRTQPRRHTMEDIARPVPPPIAQQVPVFNYAIPQQAPMYFFPGPQIPTTLPLGVMNAHVQFPAPVFRPQEAPYPRHPGGMASGYPKAHEQHQEQAEPADNVFPSPQPTWWQRFYRAFTLPVGDASTVSSSSSPEPLDTLQAADADNKPPTTSPRSDGLKVRFDDQRERKELQLPIDDQDDVSSMLCNLNTSSDSLSSIRSDVATVHSDDFEMPRRRN